MKNRILCFLVLILLLWMGSACAESAGGWIASREDLNGKRMGIVTGTSFEAPTLQFFPSSEYLYYNSYTDVAAALINKKIDGFLGDEPALRILVGEVPEITYLPEKLVSDEYAFGFGKSGQRPDMLRRQFNEMLAEIKADGTLEALGDKWFGDDEAVKVVDLKNGYSGENGKLNVVTTATDVPFSYVKDNQYVGLSIELVEMFCRRFGYTPVIADVDFSARMPGLVSGKYDMCASSMAITEERKESISFSEPFYQGGIVLTVRKADAPTQTAESAGLSGQSTVSGLDALNGKRIGVLTGTTCATEAEARLPDATIVHANNMADELAMLRAGKVDAIVSDQIMLRYLQIENDDLEVLTEKLSSISLAPMFTKSEKGRALCEEYNAFVQKLWADGTMEALQEVWLGKDESLRTVLDYEALPDVNGTLTMALDATLMPCAYVKDGRIVGYDVDIAARFCEANGYRLKIVNSSFDGVLASVQNGKCDFASCGITITDERAEIVLFGMPILYSGNTAAVLKQKDASSSASAASGYASVQDLNGKRIGVQTGTICGALVESRLPNAQVYYYNTVTDVLAALNAGKLDAGCMDEPMLRFLKIENPQIKILDELLDKSNLAAVFPKTEAGQALCSQYSEFLEKLWEDGTMKEIDAVWFGEDDGKRTVIDFASLPAANGTLRMAADLSMAPFTYMKDNKIVGYDVDVAARFCQAYGYALEIVPMDFGGILPSVQSGKCEFASSCITVTEERAESVLFSSPNYYGGIAVGVRMESALSSEPNFSGDTAPAVLTEKQQTASSAVQQESFWDGIVSSFNKTFIRENRWELFLEGVGTTMLITLLSILFGTVLGFVVFMLCRNGNLVANGATRFSIWLVTGTPMVVLLMILYYIIFGSVAISGIAVAVIGFTLTFGAAVFSLLKMGVGTIDRGQYEAAYALGHSNRHTFFKIILPQAIPHVLPAYQGEIVGLIKATAIVGYIAVQDLTKMGDIVRSRTYEAFFPLIAVTVIYFVLEGLFSFAVSRIRISIDPKKRKRERILKGVNLHD